MDKVQLLLTVIVIVAAWMIGIVNGWGAKAAYCLFLKLRIWHQSRAIDQLLNELEQSK